MHRYEHKLEFFADSHLRAQGGIKRTPKGLTFVSERGSLRHAAGVSAILAMYAKGLDCMGEEAKSEELLEFAERQVRKSIHPESHGLLR